MSSPDATPRDMLLLLPARAKAALPSLQRLRSAIAGTEDADAKLTGMTRSLDRRLLALNLQPVAPLMKVA